MQHLLRKLLFHLMGFSALVLFHSSLIAGAAQLYDTTIQQAKDIGNSVHRFTNDIIEGINDTADRVINTNTKSSTHSPESVDATDETNASDDDDNDDRKAEPSEEEMNRIETQERMKMRNDLFKLQRKEQAYASAGAFRAAQNAALAVQGQAPINEGAVQNAKKHGSKMKKYIIGRLFKYKTEKYIKDNAKASQEKVKAIQKSTQDAQYAGAGEPDAINSVKFYHFADEEASDQPPSPPAKKGPNTAIGKPATATKTHASRPVTAKATTGYSSTTVIKKKPTVTLDDVVSGRQNATPPEEAKPVAAKKVSKAKKKPAATPAKNTKAAAVKGKIPAAPPVQPAEKPKVIASWDDLDSEGQGPTTGSEPSATEHAFDSW